MKKLFVYLIIIIISINCNSKFENFSTNHFWTLDCVNLLHKKFAKYKEETISRCTNKDSDSAYRIFTYMIFKFDFENHKNKALKYIRNHKIKYDSLYVVINFNAEVQMEEFPNYNAEWYIVRNNIIIEQFYTSSYMGKIKTYNETEPISSLKEDLKRIDGCDNSIVIATVVKPNDEFEIVHMALNPDSPVIYEE
jgi:hypothetical protein